MFVLIKLVAIVSHWRGGSCRATNG